MRTRRLAITVSVLGFFCLAFVGWFSGLAPHVCAIRGAVGMVALYVMVRLANRFVSNIIADAIVRNATERETTRNAGRDRRT